VVPLLPGALRGEYDASIAVIRESVRRQLAADGALGGLFARPIQWFYTPMPAPAMIGAFDERAVVYDCMDELSQFRFAPRRWSIASGISWRRPTWCSPAATSSRGPSEVPSERALLRLRRGRGALRHRALGRPRRAA
jgi:hypothetical protein